MRRLLRIGVPVLVAALAVQAAWAAPAAAADDPVLVGAGDIGDCTSSGDQATAELLDGIPGTVVALGDIAYPSGSTANFRDCYAPSWGRHRAQTKPAPGNHEYKTPGAGPYFDYFGSSAGARGKGWYSYDRGAWHIVVLNSNCAAVGGCGATSPQVSWLKADLAANAGDHVLAYWHHPRYSSGQHGNATAVQAFWEVLYAAGAEVVLNGHDHDYERFAPQDPWGRSDAAFGIRQFVVGTGGTALRPMATAALNSEAFSARHGVLKLTLRSDGYDWAFVPVAGTTFSDVGSGSTHGPPPARTRHTFAATGDAWVDQAHPARNYGHAAKLIVDGNTGNGMDAHAYVKVKVANTMGRIDRAALRLRVTNATRDGPKVAATTTGWSPNAITWANRPPPTGPFVWDLGAVSSGTWVELDVTALVRRNATYAFVLRPTSSDGIDVWSNQGTYPPRLVVETVATP